MGETDLHRTLMADLIGTLMRYYKGQQVYVSGNLLLFYRQKDKRRHVSPDVLVTKGLGMYPRLNYILWQEKLPPNFVIEITSASTRREDTKDKFELYRDEINVAEYFVFDPNGEYLNPQLQGWRLAGGEYLPIPLVERRMPSEQLGLHLEADGNQLRLYNPATRRWLPTLSEEIEERDQELEKSRRKAAKATEEAKRLQKELDAIKKRKP